MFFAFIPLHRRSVCSFLGLVAVSGFSGCLSKFTDGDGRFSVSSSHPEKQALQIRITPDYGAGSVFTETITVAEMDTRIKRDAVVTSRNDDDFFVEVQQDPSGETYETVSVPHKTFGTE